MKPINMKTWEVRAVLDGRKSTFRRVVKEIDGYINCDCGACFIYDKLADAFYCTACGYPAMDDKAKFLKPIYRPGEILWVRETWEFLPCHDCKYACEKCNRIPKYRTYHNAYDVQGCYLYKADVSNKSVYDIIGTNIVNMTNQKWYKWRSPIHMPREAARLFLRVNDVRVERLQDTTPEPIDELLPSSPTFFKVVWDSAIKPADRDKYGWHANPWVFVIHFERIARDEA